MAKKTDRSTFWELRNSLYMVFAFIPTLTCISFFRMARRTRCKKWIIAACIYAFLTFLLFFMNGDTTYWSIVLIGTYISGIIHIFISRKEYLIRLDAYLKSNKEKESQKDKRLKESVYKEYGINDPSKQPNITLTLGSEKIQKQMTGIEYIKKIQELNESIVNEKVRGYFNSIEMVCNKIFAYVDKHPEKESSINTFTNYYLPEYFNLLATYDELSQNPMKGKNILNTIAEIEDILSTILEAFKNLYNDLYDDRIFDISNNIKVLKDSLVNNGLTDNNENILEFKK